MYSVAVCVREEEEKVEHRTTLIFVDGSPAAHNTGNDDGFLDRACGESGKNQIKKRSRDSSVLMVVAPHGFCCVHLFSVVASPP